MRIRTAQLFAGGETPTDALVGAEADDGDLGSDHHAGFLYMRRQGAWTLVGVSGGSANPHGIADHLDDSARIGSGLAAAKPAHVLNRVFHETDTGILVRSTGAAWVEMVRAESSTRLAFLSEKAHASLTGVTADQHHAQAHALVGADHTASGLTTGHVLTATGATTFAFAALTASQVSDFNEAAQDAVGGALTDSASIDFTYSDAGNTITAAVLPAGVDHNSLANLTTGDPHTQYELEANLTEDVQDIVGAFLVDSSTIDFTYSDAGNSITVAVIPGGVSHPLLGGLTASDAGHTQFALLAGRTGGQTLKGGVDASENLTLQSTNDATRGLIVLLDPTHFRTGSNTFTTTPNWFVFPGTYTVNFATGSLGNLVNFSGTLVFDQGASGSNALTLVANTGIIKNVSGEANSLGAHAVLLTTPTYQADAATLTLTQHRVVFDNPTFSILSGGVMTVTQVNSIQSKGTVNTGATITTRRGILVEDYTGAGAITTQVGIDINALTLATTNLSIRSAGSTTQMRHAGPGVFGANAAPTNASVGLEVQSTTLAFLLPRMTTTQRDALTAVDGMMIYNTTTATVQARVAGVWTTI